MLPTTLRSINQDVKVDRSMTILLHKKISINDKQKSQQPTSFSVHGKLMGWTDGERIIDCNTIQKTIEEQWKEGGPDLMANLMRGIVGPCIIEIKSNDEIWFFASCASSGFYWIFTPRSDDSEYNYLVSNDEGRFLRQAFNMGGKITDGALMNAVLSHQSVIRPLFDGLIAKSKRCPPGFYAKFFGSEPKLQSYLFNDQPKSRKQQDVVLKKKMKAIGDIYKSYCKIHGVSAKLSFSGGVDSTALLLNHKDGLDESVQGYYINRGKLSEMKMAADIANRANCQIDFVKPHEGFSITDIRRRAETGLSIMNGLVYMKHGFHYSPYNFDDEVDRLILTGQNSDLLFHVDTHAPSSFSTGIVRVIKMSSGIISRFKTTVIYYTICRILKKNNKYQDTPPGVIETYTSLSEHGTKKYSLPDGVINIIKIYKKENYVLPLVNWLKSEFYPILSGSVLSGGEKDNHAVRLARWLRTVGNIQQQFLNVSSYEKTTICTPYSEGPLAVELLSYRLGLTDVLFPKIFLHKYIHSKLKITYNNIRKKILKDRLIYYPSQIIYYGSKYLIQKVKKFVSRQKNTYYKPLSSHHVTSRDDISNLREILGYQDGAVERVLLKYVNDNACKKYLSFLYDCIDLKVDPDTLSSKEGMQLCRLVNLQIMMNKKEDF